MKIVEIYTIVMTFFYEIKPSKNKLSFYSISKTVGISIRLKNRQTVLGANTQDYYKIFFRNELIFIYE